jgi:small basic protein
MIPLLGLIVGILIGILVPVHIPIEYSTYAAVAILAALDSVLGGLCASMEGRFDLKIFLSGFFANSVLAALLAYIGDRLATEFFLISESFAGIWFRKKKIKTGKLLINYKYIPSVVYI